MHMHACARTHTHTHTLTLPLTHTYSLSCTVSTRTLYIIRVSMCVNVPSLTGPRLGRRVQLQGLRGGLGGVQAARHGALQVVQGRGRVAVGLGVLQAHILY